MKVIIHSNENCMPCNMTKKKLNEFGVSYNEILLSEDEEALAFVKQELGHNSAPVVVVKDGGGNIVEHWSGFRPDKLKALATKLNG